MSATYLKEYNKTHLRASQLKQLEVLKVIVDICERHGITYWLEGGTLLGAVRHGGFIPWDDDIDIAMTKEDLDRFTQIAQQELPANLFLQNKQTDSSYRLDQTKVIDLNSFYVQPDDDFETASPKGLFVDIFPYVSYPYVPKRLRRPFLRGICIANSVLKGKHYYSLESTAKLMWFGLKYLLFYQFLWRILPKSSKYLTCLPTNNWYGMMQRRDEILPVGRIFFEGMELNAPNNPDAYLKNLYKDYMKLPPEEKRQIHSVFICPDLI